MKVIYKYLKPYLPFLLLAIVLVGVQAWCDLALPTYTSEIVDVGLAASGIEDDLPRIKERFYKGVSSKRGTGLGLAVADEIMHLHGGDLFIDSKLGEGTKVTILMPKEKQS